MSLFTIVNNNNEPLKEIEFASSDSRNEGQTSTDDVVMDEVILSVYWKNGKLGAVAYSLKQSEVHVLYDIVDVNPEFRLLNSLFLQVQPCKVVTCSSLSDIFLKTVKNLASEEINDAYFENGSSTASNANAEMKVRLLSAKSFNVDTARHAIFGLRLPGEPDNASEEDRRNHILSQLNLSANVSFVAAFGGLLNFLGKSLGRINYSTPINPILAINVLSLNNLVWVDNDSLRALQVFSAEHHPSPFKWNERINKEGVSILSLFNRCSSSLGTKRMRALLSQPTQDISIINERQDVIEFLLDISNAQIVDKLVSYISNIRSVTDMLRLMTNGRQSIPQWKSFYKTLYYSILVGDLCKEYAENLQLFSKIASLLCDSLYVMGHCIYRIIDFEESADQKRFCVHQGVSESLDRLKEDYGRLPDLLSELLQLDTQDLPASMASYCMVYLPEVGYLIAVNEWSSTMSDHSIRNIPGLRFQFNANGIPHYKSRYCLQLDEKLGDTWVKIVEQESKIMLQVLQFIRKNVKPLLAMLEPISELDCLIAMAQVAKQNHYVRPQLVDGEEQLIEIIEGRHPLQEMYVDSFISNDTKSSLKDGLIKIIMGPNNSGKSVYLKQVALIAYLAHTGSFVPAKSARIGVLDQIHTRIQTTESISTQLSAFMIDIRQMILSIYNSTNRSLLLVDEFGRGTAELDGLAMASAFLTHFVSRGPACPHLLCTTHAHSLPHLLPPTNIITLMTTDYMIENEELVYLYKLKEGSMKSGLAIKYVLAGICPALVEGALKNYEKMKMDVEAIRKPPSCNAELKMKMEKLKEILEDPLLANNESIRQSEKDLEREIYNKFCRQFATTSNLTT